MIRRPPRSTPLYSSAASDVYKRQQTRITELFGQGAASIDARKREFIFRYRSPQHWMDVFKTYYGPLLKTFAALQPAAQEALTDDIMALIDRMNISGDDTMVVPSEYLELVISKR